MTTRVITLLFVFTTVLNACSSRLASKKNANSLTNSASAVNAQSIGSTNALSGSPTPSEPTLIGTWTGQVMIDQLPATVSFTFQENGNLIFDLGPTERSR